VANVQAFVVSQMEPNRLRKPNKEKHPAAQPEPLPKKTNIHVYDYRSLGSFEVKGKSRPKSMGKAWTPIVGPS
jgi:hypothetical protein